MLNEQAAVALCQDRHDQLDQSHDDVAQDGTRESQSGTDDTTDGNRRLNSDSFLE